MTGPDTAGSRGTTGTAGWRRDHEAWNGVASPYFAWWRLIGGREDRADTQGVGSTGSALPQPLDTYLRQLRAGTAPDWLAATGYQTGRGIGDPDGGDHAVPGAAARRAEALDLNPVGEGHHPIRPYALNPDYDAFMAKGGNPAPDLSHFQAADLPPEDAVFTGIIDSAIALGHQRFTCRNGTTRIFAAWQQAAARRAGPATEGHPAPDAGLPFGRELLKPEIDATLARNTHAGLLDEEGFCRDAGLTDTHLRGARNEIEQGAAHGTHVLDLAAGADPTNPATTDEMLRRQPILVVNMPDHLTIGTSGSFLEYFVFHAILRIVEVADALWARRTAEYGPAKDGRKGYPIVINLSYGLQAGPKDGTTFIENFVTWLIQQRLDDGKSPLRIVLPAGNDNLAQGNAVWTLRKDSGGKAFPWRVLPEDQSSNYLEVWSGAIAEGADLPLALSITEPDGRVTALGVGDHGEFFDVAGCARVYCSRVTGTPSEVQSRSGQQGAEERPPAPAISRQRYVICLSPSLDHRGGIAAPAGLWTVGVALSAGYPDHEIDAFLHIQTDQSARPNDESGFLSYFDDSHYRPFEENGAERDTYLWTDAPGIDDEHANREPNNRQGPVQRKGTLNAIASLTDAIVVAGHRASDGRPAPYSSSGMGAERKEGRAAPTLSYPSDDGPAHPGLLAAGSRSARAVIMQGTSFATALATRDVARDLAGWDGGADWLHGPGSASAAEAHAKSAEAAAARKGRIFSWKSGRGRMAAARGQRQLRIDPD